MRNTNSGKVTNLTQIGTVHGDLTIFTADRPVPTATAARPYLLLETGEVVGRTVLRNVLKWQQARGRMVRAALGPDFL